MARRIVHQATGAKTRDQLVESVGDKALGMLQTKERLLQIAKSQGKKQTKTNNSNNKFSKFIYHYKLWNSFQHEYRQILYQ